MTEVIGRLAAAERIAEWIDPYDQRLISFTGTESPVNAALFRACWEVANATEEQIVAREVGRLLVPQATHLTGTADIRFTNELFGEEMGEGMGNVVARFSEGRDWSNCFPTDRAAIFTRTDGRVAWGAIGLCDNLFGLAVFSQELVDGSIEARIQTVPDEALQQILAAK